MNNKYTWSEFFQELLDAQKDNIMAQDILESISKASVNIIDRSNAEQDSNFFYGCLALPESKPRHIDNLVGKLGEMTGP